MGHLPSDNWKFLHVDVRWFDAYPQAHLCWWCRFGDMRSSHRSGGEPDANPGAHRSDAACPRGICRTSAIPLHGTAFEERMDYRTRTDVRRHFRKRGATPSHLCPNARIAGVNPPGLAPGLFCGPEFLCLRVRTFQNFRPTSIDHAHCTSILKEVDGYMI
jgi:hypothetical protein